MKNSSKSSLIRALSVFVIILLEVIVFVLLTGTLSRVKEKSAMRKIAEQKNIEQTAEEGALVKPEEVKVTMGPTPTPVPTIPPFSPHSVESTEPSRLIATTGIQIDGVNTESYHCDDDIQFGLGSSYTNVDGIITFRGNNFRDKPTYGNAKLTQKKFGSQWEVATSGLSYGSASWSGSGWTGQPLMEKWPANVKKHMNMYDSAKYKDDLVEVIYACMDGYVYFLDLETGERTRDPLFLGFTFKGAGALDPRGYPIMYVGAGYDSNMGTAHVFIVNLLDCSVMYEFGALDEFSLRGALSYFDGSALVDAETDTLIYPGENGILYKIKLNTKYNRNAGTLSINPGPMTKWNYYGTRSSTAAYWVGMEDSPVIYGNYMFVADNGGNFMCMDLNTLELVWVQDILDDSNSTPVMEIEDGHPYLYVSTSFHLGWRSSDSAEIPIWKIDAETGEIVWNKSYQCYSMEGVSGGVQSTIALGEKSLSDYLYVTVSRTPSASSGVLACINKHTGEVLWEHSSAYAWSSPLCVYGESGDGVVIYATSEGMMFMLDGLTGEVKDQVQLVGNIEASPAVYKNKLIVGSRECKIYGINLE